jgi:hypothetical protein
MALRLWQHFRLLYLDNFVYARLRNAQRIIGPPERHFERQTGGRRRRHQLGQPHLHGYLGHRNRKAGHALGQAAPAIAALKAGSVQDILPLSSPTNVLGTIVDKNGYTHYSPSALFDGALYGNTGFTSAVWNLGSGDYVDFGFSIDSFLTVEKGWDNATGFGTPNGLTFINAVAKSK